MSNRWFNQFKGSLEKGVVMLDGYGEISGVDASVVNSACIKGASWARTGTGEYTITLEDSYPSLLSCNVTFECAATNALWAKVKSHDVSSAKTIVLNTVDSTGAPTDTSLGCALLINIVLKNSVV